MALSPTRIEFRLRLAHVDRAIDREATLIVGQHPSETAHHLVLRVLAWCVLNHPRLEFGPGLSTPDAADLWSHDLTGRLETWVECGAAPPERVKKLIQHHADASIHAFLDDPERVEELLAEARNWKRAPRPESLAVWLVDRALVDDLAETDARRRKWAVTIVGDHIYVDEDGKTKDGSIVRVGP